MLQDSANTTKETASNSRDCLVFGTILLLGKLRVWARCRPQCCQQYRIFIIWLFSSGHLNKTVCKFCGLNPPCGIQAQIDVNRYHMLLLYKALALSHNKDTFFLPCHPFLGGGPCCSYFPLPRLTCLLGGLWCVLYLILCYPLFRCSTG